MGQKRVPLGEGSKGVHSETAVTDEAPSIAPTPGLLPPTSCPTPSPAPGTGCELSRTNAFYYPSSLLPVCTSRKETVNQTLAGRGRTWAGPLRLDGEAGCQLSPLCPTPAQRVPPCAPQCETQHTGGCGQLSPGRGRRSGVRRRRRGNSRAGWPWAGKDRHREAVWEKASSGLETQQEPSRPHSRLRLDQTALSGALRGRGPSYAQSRGLGQGRPRKCWGSRRGKLDWGPGIGWSEWGQVRGAKQEYGVGEGCPCSPRQGQFRCDST